MVFFLPVDRLLGPFTPNNAREMEIIEVDLLVIAIGVVYCGNASRVIKVAGVGIRYIG